MRSHSIFRPLAGSAVAGLLAALASAPVLAQSSSSANSTYEQHRAYCMQMSNQVDTQACLREAGAAEQERRRGNGLAVPSDAERQANALRRCERLPEPQRADCVRLRQSSDVQTRGSVTGGGVFREMRIIEYGQPMEVPVQRAPATPGGVTVIPPAATTPAAPATTTPGGVTVTPIPGSGLR